MENAVSIVIVSYKTRDLLRKCLDAVYGTAARPVEVYVVDNASGDGSVEMVQEAFPQVKVISNAENRGFAAANNQALRLVDTPYVMLLNPDTELQDDALERLLTELENLRPQAGILAAQLLNSDGSPQASESKYYSFWDTLLNNRAFRTHQPEKQYGKEPKPIDWAHGAVMVFRKSLMDDIGLLDEGFFIYAEEIDYYLRAKKAGYTAFLIPEAKVIHHGAASTRQKRSEMFIQNYRSFYRLLRKHYSWLDYVAYRVRSLLLILFWRIRFTLKGDKELQALYRDLWKWHLNPQES